MSEESIIRKEEITTPSLLDDLDAMESNLRAMARFFEGRSCKVRPHFKNHKSPALARKQVEGGAIGITCATMREAEILVENGIDNILIANEIAGQEKCERLAEISRLASVMVAADSETAIRDLAAAQRNRKGKIAILVDVNIGMNRCGLEPGNPALELARYALAQGLTVRGIMGYDGHMQVTPPSAERDVQVLEGSKALVETAALFTQAGIDTGIVSTGGTGTHSVAGVYPGITEIQAGSYLLMDNAYLSRSAPFQRSLTVLATVVSTRGKDHAVLDCGIKEMNCERGLPTVKDVPGAQVKALHAEHALIELDPLVSPTLTPGQKVELWVHYSDGTVNLHSAMYGIRKGQVEEVFAIEH